MLAWHTERGRLAELAGLLGRAGAAVGTVATDLVLLAQTEVGEVREEVAGRGGSSTLPHKRNPVAAVSARAAAIAAPGLVASLLTAATLHEHERAAGPWHAEWRPLVELLRTVGSGASWLADALAHLAVDPERVAASLDVTGGLLLAEQATTGLRGRLGHAAAKDLVTAAAGTAQDEHRPFADVLIEALAALDHPPDDPAAEVRALLDPAAAVGEAAALVDDFLRSATGEPVSPHPSTQDWDPAGEEVRRAVLGDAHVDRAVANTDDVTADFQDFITRYAWGGIWTRPGSPAGSAASSRCRCSRPCATTASCACTCARRVATA